MKPNLVVVSTCFNSPTEVKCRASVALQTLRVSHVFIDAARQETPKTHSENLYDAVKGLHPDDVVIQLDGDDWLPHAHVLEQIASIYEDPEVWLTYGSFATTDGAYASNNAPYAPHEDIRTAAWRCSHLKTFRAGLFQRINPEDLKLPDGTFTGRAVDHATMFPMVEMAGWDRTRWVKDVLYIYNWENSTQATSSKLMAVSMEAAFFFRSKPRYSRLSAYRRRDLGAIYDECFFADYQGQQKKDIRAAADGIFRTFTPKTAIDVGAGPGQLVEKLRELGVDACGFDGSEHAFERADENVRPYLWQEDITLGLHSTAIHDLVICTEVAEHIPAEYADVLVRKLCNTCAIDGAIVFTAAPPGQGGHDHINEQPFSYWEAKFGAEGFAVDRDKTEQLRREWLHLMRMPWYAQNVRVLRAKSSVTSQPDTHSTSVKRSSAMKIHVLGVPHTKTTPEFSTCAFTQKTLTLCKMLTRRGHHVIHYGVEGSNPECTENVSVMRHDVWEKQFGHPGKEFYKTDVSGEFAPYHARYAANLRAAILDRTGEPFTEIICHPWNGTQPQATEGIPQYRVESGIGYRGAWAPWRVYESYAWLHMHLGAAGTWQGGQWYWNVIPNAFDLSQFAEPKAQRSGDFLYLGRLNFDKGVGIACDTAKAVGARITIVGQGDPTPYLAPHVTYRPPVGIEERRELLANARALFAPTIYIEPFGSTHVEAMLSGVPVITSDFGVFPETNLHGITGYRCRTMEQFAWAARNIDRIDGHVTAKWARDNFAMERVVLQYEEFFDQCLRVRDMNGPVDGPTGFYGLNPERTELDSLRRYYPGFEYSSAPPTSVDPFPKPTPVISFVVRAHNEEATLRESITSLFPITQPIEIVVILHRCTDGSKEIAMACQEKAPARHKVKIVEYEIPVSRAGLETLVTPTDSPHSFENFCNWSFSQASSAWRFKWDADFVATPGFVAWIDGRDWTLQDARALNVPHRSPDGVVGREPYGHNCLRHFVKHDFWEVPMFPSDFVLEEVSDDAAFVHASRLSEVKAYWRNDPWFFNCNVAETYGDEAAELREAYGRLVKLVGPEPIGCARSNNPECDAYLERCRNAIHQVANGAAKAATP
jgi:glycosyltransferase involved in cell wall biosynthesis